MCEQGRAKKAEERRAKKEAEAAAKAKAKEAEKAKDAEAGAKDADGKRVPEEAIDGDGKKENGPTAAAGEEGKVADAMEVDAAPAAADAAEAAGAEPAAESGDIIMAEVGSVAYSHSLPL